MSAERSIDAWEEMQRHGHDLADRLAQGFTVLLHTRVNPPSFSWHNSNLFDVDFPINKGFGTPPDFGFPLDNSGINGVLAIFDIGSRLGQAGAELGANVNGVVQQFFRRLPVPFRQDDHEVVPLLRAEFSRQRSDVVLDRRKEESGDDLAEQLRNFGFTETSDLASSDESAEANERSAGFDPKFLANLARTQASVNISSTYDSRTRKVESSLVARGDMWRVEASNDRSTSTTENPPFLLVQLGALLFVRASTLLLPFHWSKHHLLWYGYDRQKGMHSLCPAVWSKHRRWLMMSMICLNPLACSLMDLQFPNGQFTYISGEGLTSSAFVPVLGGLLQAQGQFPGESRFSFSCKNKWGTRITPSILWPDKSFSLGLEQALAWQRSGLIVKPTVRFSVCPTFGGSDPGMRAELIHSVKEKLNLIYGYACTTHPSAFASISLGRSNWNGNVGSSGIVVKVETPVGRIGRPFFTIQFNSGIDFLY